MVARTRGARFGKRKDLGGDNGLYPAEGYIHLANEALHDIIAWLGFSSSMGADGYLATLAREKRAIFKRAEASPSSTPDANAPGRAGRGWRRTIHARG